MKKRPRRLDTTANESPTCDDLTREQKSELVHGPRIWADFDAFDSDEHRRREWLRHRTAILHRTKGGVWGGPYTDRDRRPWAWWRYEYLGDGPPAEFDEERYPWPWREEGVELHKLGGELSPRAELLNWQRAEERWSGALESLKRRPAWWASKGKPSENTAEEKQEIAHLERVLANVERGIRSAKARQRD